MKDHPRPNGLRDTYDRIAEDWAKDHVGDTWWRECTAKFASLLPPNARVLDAGCGSGQKAKFFEDRGAHVLGIDFSERLLEIARQTATASDFRLLDLRDIRTLSEEFDGVFAQASLLHIPKAETGSVIEGMVSRLVPLQLLHIGRDAGPTRPIRPVVGPRRSFASVFEFGLAADHRAETRVGYTLLER